MTRFARAHGADLQVLEDGRIFLISDFCQLVEQVYCLADVRALLGY